MRTKFNWKGFLGRQGFYLLMIGCIGAIGAAALVSGLAGKNENARVAAVPTATVMPVTNPEAVIAPTAPPAETAQVPTGVVLTMPVAGDVVQPYSMDALVFSSTLRHWQTHAGVDIAAEEGTAVMAALDGIVESVTQDLLMGTTVTIAHENAKTVYASLKSAGVEPDTPVVAGQTIGTVGTTASAELQEGPHVHFEYLVDGAPADPTPSFMAD